MEKLAKQKMYMDYLTEESYFPKIDEDGDVEFKLQSKSFYIDVDEEDDKFFSMFLPNLYKVDSPHDQRLVLLACDYSNRESKVSKAQIIRDYVYISVELFIDQPDGFKKVFKRSLRAIVNGTAKFAEKLKELSDVKAILEDRDSNE